MAKRLLFAAAVLFVATLVVHAAADEPGAPSRLCDGEPCDAVKRGLASFLDGQLEGLGANGRSCADCHMPTDHFQLSPDNVEARFQRLQARRHGDTDADDPLFRPVDADDFRVNGEAASDFGTLRRLGLIRITLPLPGNVKLLDAAGLPTGEKFVDVWRMVPSVNDVAITGPDFQNPWFREPNKTGGYQLDARIATLRDQALVAFQAHAQTRLDPEAQVLDDLASFQRTLFTNNHVRKLAEAVRLGVDPLPDPDQGLSPLETEGKAVFVRACAQCHGGPAQTLGQIAPPLVIRYHDIATTCPRPQDTQSPPRWKFDPCPADIQNKVRTYEFTMSPTLKIVRTSSDPGRALLTGFVGLPPAVPGPRDDWQKFDMPALRGIRNTAPYFHNNSAATLEAVVDHYIEFFKRVQAVAVLPPPAPLPPIITTDFVNIDRPVKLQERAALLAYLRKL
jgi:cytochrome c peroxidase